MLIFRSSLTLTRLSILCEAILTTVSSRFNVRYDEGKYAWYVREFSFLHIKDKGGGDTHNRYTPLYIFNGMLFRFVLVPFSQDETSLTLIVIILCHAKYPLRYDLLHQFNAWKRKFVQIYIAFEFTLPLNRSELLIHRYWLSVPINNRWWWWWWWR